MAHVFLLKFGVHGTKRLIGKKRLIDKQVREELYTLRDKDLKLRKAYQMEVFRINTDNGAEESISKSKYNKEKDSFSMV